MSPWLWLIFGMTLFATRGWGTRKQRWATSYHVGWAQLLLDAYRVAAVRQASALQFVDLKLFEARGMRQRRRGGEEEGMTLLATLLR